MRLILVPIAMLFTVNLFFGEPIIAQETTADTVHGKSGITLPAPPPTRKTSVTEEYKSASRSSPVSVTDSYRWLEDAKSPETRAFIAAQNAYTQKYLDQLKILPEVKTQMGKLLRVDAIENPEQRGDRFFFTKQMADENQASIYMRVGLHGKDERLIDANKLSADQNTSVIILDISEDGSLMIYGLRVGGADEMELHFLNLVNRKTLPDVLPAARYYGAHLSPDKRGVYYSKFFPHAGTSVFYHALGGAVSDDKAIFGREYRGEKLGEIDNVGIHVTADGHYLILSVGHGVPARREDILLKDLRQQNAQIVPLVYGVNNRFSALEIDDAFYVNTDYDAPNHRVLKAELGKPPDQWKTIIPAGGDVIEQVSLVDRKLYVLRLKDVKSELTAYTLDGKAAGEIRFPGLGAGSTVSGRPDQHGGFYTFQSIITPPSIYHYKTTSGRSELFATQKVPFNPAEYELKEVFYRSKDGTRVPMFIAGRKGLKRDGSERLLMTGYGGFALSERPVWYPAAAWWMQQGGWFALPDLRGGNEYGEAWHKAAMFEKKQNVFDDWFAAAEYLIREKYTSAPRLAIRGRSNGGLLMGASMTQRPELFGAIWCGYPLLDMLRYQRFLMGRTWTTEYGSAENPADFDYIYKYSPYQHVQNGTRYPAIMFFTGDGDTRVDPMNARKMTPLVQSASASGRPVLLHYSIKGGHSAGISQTQLIEDYSDEMAFLWTETGN
jgi:prolyl oligopeptidase